MTSDSSNDTYLIGRRAQTGKFSIRQEREARERDNKKRKKESERKVSVGEMLSYMFYFAVSCCKR